MSFTVGMFVGNIIECLLATLIGQMSKLRQWGNRWLVKVTQLKVRARTFSLNSSGLKANFCQLEEREKGRKEGRRKGGWKGGRDSGREGGEREGESSYSVLPF